MWNRSDLKDQAKMFLRKHYWQAFLVALVMLFAGNEGNHIFSFRVADFRWVENQRGIVLALGQVPITLTGTFGEFLRFFKLPFVFVTSYRIMAMAIIGALLFGIFVLNPLIVGGKKYFMESNRLSNQGNLEKPDASVLGFAFTSGFYLNIVKIMFLKELYLMLWTLLLLIPGIVKSYEYILIPYYLAENPGMDSQEAFRKSMESTEGHKWNMLILSLSFLGWMLLGGLLFGIGGIFVSPYVESTWAQLYLWFDETEKETQDSSSLFSAEIHHVLEHKENSQDLLT